jgi:hypothetical protein
VITDWKRYGTSFLLVAILLNVLGGLIAPLQQVFLSSKRIKTPVYSQHMNELLDIPDQWKYSNSSDPDDVDDNLVVTVARNAFKSASNVEPQSQLWQGAGSACNSLELQHRTTDGIPASCGRGNTLGSFANLVDLFLAELPSDYNTGLIRQFIPRINSTASYHNITASEYPQGCDQLPGAYYVAYFARDNTNLTGWTLEACMPADMRKSPWMSTRDRQDFSEVMYLNVSVSLSELDDYDEAYGGSFYRVVLNTTAGYFELPNYMNGGVPGPLLEKDPNSQCGDDCTAEGFTQVDIR